MARSMRRLVKTSRSESLPSRLKYPPGIFPAAEYCSRYSIVNGKKPGNSFDGADVTVAKITVPPCLSNTAPSAWRANLPISTSKPNSSFLNVRTISKGPIQ